MCPAYKVKKFEFWRAHLGGKPQSWQPQFLLAYSFVLMSTYSENLIHLALSA